MCCEMEQVSSVNIGETPHCAMNASNRSLHSSCDSADSGYLTLTPHSASTYTPTFSGCRTRLSCSLTKRHHRHRTEPWQSERGHRHRSKLNHLLNASEAEYSIIEHPEEEDSGLDASSSFLAASTAKPERRQQQRCPAGIDLSTTTKSSSSSSTDWRTTVAITPATSRLQLLSPPPSPAVPSSSFIASEPIDEDVEMKLVIVPQSTPQMVVSPRGRRAGRTPTIVTSAENRKLSKLTITELHHHHGVAEIKPKRLDFSRRALSAVLHRTRATPDYTGRETVDLLALLGEKSNHWRIVGKILAYLQPQDLCAVSMVSKAWRQICAGDSRANRRRLSHIILRQNAKENLKIVRKAKAAEGDIQSSPKSRYARKGLLREVQNVLQVPGQQMPPNSPPVSPSKVKFHSFVKASRTLAPWEHLLPCPKCTFPCHVDHERNVGKCSRQGCSIEFCTTCSSRPHAGPCNTPLLATPTKRNKRTLVVGSRQSKRNLRRL